MNRAPGKFLLIAASLFALAAAAAAVEIGGPRSMIEPMADLPCTVGDESRGAAFLGGMLVVPTQCNDGVIAFNVADPSNPLEIGRIDNIGWPEDVVAMPYDGPERWKWNKRSLHGVHGDENFTENPLLDDPFDRVWPGRRLLVVSATPGGVRLHKVFVDDLEHPTSFRASGIGLLAFEDRVVNLALDGGSLYAVTPHAFHVLDIADPTRPAVIGSLEIPDGFSIYGMDVEGTVAVVQIDCHAGIGGYAGLRTIDVSVPSAPALLAARGYCPDWADRVENLASTPDVQCYEYDYIWGCGMDGDVQIVDQRAYVAGMGDGVMVWNIARPDRPAHERTLYFSPYVESGCASDVAVGNGVAFVTSVTDFAIVPFDVRDPRGRAVRYDPVPLHHPLTTIIDGELIYVTGTENVCVMRYEPPHSSGQILPETEEKNGRELELRRF